MWLYESHTFWYFRTVQYSIGLTFRQEFGKAKSIYTKPWNQALRQLVGEF